MEDNEQDLGSRSAPPERVRGADLRDGLIVMFVHPHAVWIETADKHAVCEFRSRWPGEDERDFEDRKRLAYQVKAALEFAATCEIPSCLNVAGPRRCIKHGRMP